MLNLFQAPAGSPLPPDTPGWVQGLISAVGGWGLLAIAFFDSSIGTLPILNDLLVIWFSILRPSRWVFYATMATVGSVLGCLVVFYIGRKGGEVALSKTAKKHQIDRIRRWYEKNEFLTVALPAVLPPPTPFKIFVLAAGVFQVRLRYFLAALSLGRGVRYFFWGMLGAYWGQKALNYVRENFLRMSALAIGLILVGYIVSRLADWYRRRPSPG